MSLAPAATSDDSKVVELGHVVFHHCRVVSEKKKMGQNSLKVPNT